MIISPGRNYIFVHIPKTGGTSLALALEERAMKDDILIGDTPKARKRRNRLRHVQAAGRIWKHSTLADVDGLVPLETIIDAFTFTLVRNPWDRLVSYYHWLQGQHFDHPAVSLAQTRDFTGFLNAPQTRASIKADSFSRYMTASDGQEHCDLYVRLEHFKTDAAPLWTHLGFELPLPAANQSTRGKAYQDYYTEADRRLVEVAAAPDIERFGYQFG